MKTSLEHLPTDRKIELRQITDIIVQWATPEKVVLFGSYATGKQVIDKYVSKGVTYEYVSDFDILVITRRGEKREEYNIQETLETKCQPITTIPVNIIVHGIDYVNKRIAEGQYFFTDIKKEGILLYEAGNVPLAEQKELTTQEKKEIAQRDFNYNFPDAKEFLEGVLFYLGRKKLNIAAFQLHQATERTYNTMILVVTGYKPKTHNLGKLLKMSRDFSPELQTIFPQNTKEEIHLFNLLKKAYIDARYNENFVITEDELKTLIERVRKLQGISEQVCKLKIASF